MGNRQSKIVLESFWKDERIQNYSQSSLGTHGDFYVHLSGGVDSLANLICLWAIFPDTLAKKVEGIHFYKPTNSLMKDHVQRIADEFGIKVHMVEDESGMDEMRRRTNSSGDFVPGRNMWYALKSMEIAKPFGIVITGNQSGSDLLPDDDIGHPDASPEFQSAMNTAMLLSKDVFYQTPLQYAHKSDTWGILEMAYDYSHKEKKTTHISWPLKHSPHIYATSCDTYFSHRDGLNPTPVGCGECHKCKTHYAVVEQTKEDDYDYYNGAEKFMCWFANFNTAYKNHLRTKRILV